MDTISGVPQTLKFSHPYISPIPWKDYKIMIFINMKHIFYKSFETNHTTEI